MFKESFIKTKHWTASKSYYERNGVITVNSETFYFIFSIALYIILLLKISCQYFLIVLRDKWLTLSRLYFFIIDFDISLLLAWTSECLKEWTEYHIFKPVFNWSKSLFCCSEGELNIMYCSSKRAQHFLILINT